MSVSAHPKIDGRSGEMWIHGYQPIPPYAQLYAVDPDGATVYNLADLQTGGASVGAEWALGERNRVLLLLGAEDFENRDLAESYRNAYAYLNFTHQWR